MNLTEIKRLYLHPMSVFLEESHTMLGGAVGEGVDETHDADPRRRHEGGD